MADDNTPKWKETLNLPRTAFPMKAQLSRKEPGIINNWRDQDIYHRILEARQDGPLFILHDGPPYANGRIHLGHALNKILKDFVVRIRSMQGHRAPFVPGWDCHGLPIEHQVDQQVGERKQSMSVTEFRRLCRDYAMKYLDAQREDFMRLGVLGDWDKPYMTLQPGYESAVIDYFKSFVEAGNVYRRNKPVYWCTHCRTALAEAEVEYHDHKSHSITVRFPLPDPPDFLKPYAGKGLSVLIWTTTPWTIPANLAIALHPDADYAVFEMDGERLIAARRLVPVIAETSGKEFKVLHEFPGAALAGSNARHPLFPRDSLIITADYVVLDQGTGCVHTAPGHGEDDYQSGLRHGLDIYSPVLDDGRFDNTAGPYEGLHIEEGNTAVIRDLEAGGFLLHREEYSHSYPHCWRCHNPVIFRATAQWFISMDTKDLRRRAMDAARSVEWFPEWGRDRMLAMLENRPDWCISRQRDWGVPIPVFYCRECGEPLLDTAAIDRVREIFAQQGSESWYELEAEAFISPETRCPACGAGRFRKGMDILDVWFESGSSISVLESRHDHHYPAHVYLEGGDQFRGWYHSALLVGICVKGHSPYHTVVTHGWALDQEGKAMSKSLGNVIPPQKIIESRGAEILRLWVAMANYREDIRMGDEIISRVTESYRKIRNTWRFMLGVLDDFDPLRHNLDTCGLGETDLFILARFEEIKEKVLAAYDQYDTHVVLHTLANFFTVDLSAFYLNFSKDNLYCNHPDAAERRATQAAIYHMLYDSLLLLAPILVFTSEEAWQHIPGVEHSAGDSVHTRVFPEPRKDLRDRVDGRRWQAVMEVREAALKELEESRQRGEIGDSLEAGLNIRLTPELAPMLESRENLLTEILVVARVEFSRGDSVAVAVEPFPGVKCPRCWKRFPAGPPVEPHPELCPRCRRVIEELHGKA